MAVDDDTEAESLVYALKSRGYTTIASVEDEAQARLATIRLRSPQGVKVDLLFASSGIERESLERATIVPLPSVGALPIVRAEELLSRKVLSMSDERLQARIDARNQAVRRALLARQRDVRGRFVACDEALPRESGWADRERERWRERWLRALAPMSVPNALVARWLDAAPSERARVPRSALANSAATVELLRALDSEGFSAELLGGSACAPSARRLDFVF